MNTTQFLNKLGELNNFIVKNRIGDLFLPFLTSKKIKMKFKLFLIFAFLLLISKQELLGQVSIEWSEEMKKGMNSMFLEFLNEDENEYYLSYRYGSGFFGMNSGVRLDKYDDELKLVFSKTYKADKTLSSAKLMIKSFGNKLGMLSVNNHLSKNSFSFEITALDLMGNEGKPSFITETKYKNKLLKKDFIPDVEWIVSENKKRSLFLVSMDDDEKKEELRMEFNVLNADFSVAKKSNISLPFNQKSVEVGSWYISNEGMVFFMAYIRKKKEKAKFTDLELKKWETETIIYAYNPDTDELKEIDLGLDNLYLKSARLNLNKNGDVLCGGLYGLSKISLSTGVFFSKISGKDFSIITQAKHDFKIEDLDGIHHTGKDKITKAKGLDKTFRIRKVELLESGEGYVIAESYQSEKVKDINGDFEREYYLGELFITRVDEIGQIKEIIHLPKHQLAKKDNLRYTSFSTLEMNDKLCIVYSDNYRNIKKNISKEKVSWEIEKTNRAVPAILSIENGKLNGKTLYNWKDVKLSMNSKKIKKIGENKFLMFVDQPGTVLQKSKYRIGKVTIGSNSF